MRIVLSGISIVFILSGVGPAQDGERLTFHAAPKALSEEAVTADWHRFLGPNDDCTTPETHLVDSFPETGPPVVWEMAKGSGYTSPVLAEGKLVMFDRYGDEEVIECFEPETGKPVWRFSYPVEYTDRYGFKNGPRASAVLDSGKVYTLGVTSVLTCLSLETGGKIWQRDLDAEYEVASYFFGHGSCPLVYDGKVIVNLGGKGGLCVAAFDQNSGEQVWGTEHEWLSSYASPVVKNLQGKPRLLVFAGGDSRPPFGGLLCIDPKTGELHDAFPWRADKYESVNGSTPIAVGKNRVFITECYQIGGVMLELTPELKWKEIWRAPGFNLHWNTPVTHEGALYGFLGRNEPDAYLGSFDLETGKENWKKDITWSADSGERKYNMSYFRGSILHADSKFIILGEIGSLAMMKLSTKGYEETSRAQLFIARSTWSLPVLHRGLLYISQHETEMGHYVENSGPPRIICYDLRK
ncbi:MAG: PQQ-like beta-propeller repeat protein [Verrucomicrobiales bacterium]|nr:PQQ-like beta-propeller repeat protein [Verrucomicrobiales bacterium]